ncbi:serine hydrolase [Erythrobacter westpacificensis]|uniref:Serine hydrolase n=1 Tax=Erythrobacter westpacificensis TaxID=1055231 RepID=A0ABP9JZ28_9SPHN
MPKNPFSASLHLAIAIGLASAPAASLAQDSLPEPLLQGEQSNVPIAIQRLRWAMNDADVNALTFRSMDTLFTTRTVPRSGDVWQLQRRDHPLDFTYRYDGGTYTPEQFLDRTYTNALIVMKGDTIVYENYRNNSGPDTRFMGWSMTKSLTSLLVGMALEEGRIASLDDTIETYLPELAGGGYEGVTIRQILQMRSGVDYEERYDFANPGIAASNHINALVKNVSRFVEPAMNIRRAHEPGEVFAYKTIDTAVLGLLLERVSGGSTVASYMSERLWQPLGAERDGFFIMDGPVGTGREFTGAGYSATARDFARVGQMMLNGGLANGRQIVPSDWIELSTQPVAAATPDQHDYAMQWWTLGNGAYSAIGLQGQYIYVDPRRDTVVVKLSYYPPGNMTAQEETLAFFDAVSAWNPEQD